MDEWGVDAVVAWFHSIGYKQFDQSIREHQVRRRKGVTVIESDQVPYQPRPLPGVVTSLRVLLRT